MRRKNVGTAHVLADHRLNKGAGVAIRCCGGGEDLWKRGQIGFLQDHADVRMGDQAAALIDDIGVSALTDFQVRDHVPNELEVGLGGDHARILRRAGHRNRHVRLRLLAEVNRTEIDSAGHRVREFRITREIDVAADDVHCKTRHA